MSNDGRFYDLLDRDQVPLAQAPPEAEECRFRKMPEGIQPAYNAQLAVDAAYRKSVFHW